MTTAYDIFSVVYWSTGINVGPHVSVSFPCRDEGYEVILINSNPATIMTDPGTADRTYVGPMTVRK